MYAVLLAFFLAFSSAHAQDDDASAALSGGRFAEVAATVGLDATQRKQVTDALYASRAAKVEIQARGQKARLELQRLLAADTLDEKAILKATDALSAAEADLRRNRIQLMLSLRKTLTPDQWRQLSALRGERREERRGGRDGSR